MRYVRTDTGSDALVGLDAVKAQLRVDYPDEDILIEGLIAAAIGHLDGRSGILGRCLSAQTWRLDCAGPDLDGRVGIDLPPIQSVLSVHVLKDGTSVEWPADERRLEWHGERAFIAAKNGHSWPSRDNRPDAVQITFTTGYQDELPAPIHQAIVLIVSDLFQNREASAGAVSPEINFGVSALLAPYRVIR